MTFLSQVVFYPKAPLDRLLDTSQAIGGPKLLWLHAVRFYQMVNGNSITGAYNK